jgi:PilZ domain
MPADSRACARHQTRKAGRIIFFDAPCFIECLIRNISEDGALVSMPLSVSLPDRVVLWEERTGVIYQCDVRWKREHMVGLQFTDICGRRERRALLEQGFLPLTGEEGRLSYMH